MYEFYVAMSNTVGVAGTLMGIVTVRALMIITCSNDYNLRFCANAVSHVQCTRLRVHDKYCARENCLKKTDRGGIDS